MSRPPNAPASQPDCAVCGKPYWSHNVGAVTTCPIIATYRPASPRSPGQPMIAGEREAVLQACYSVLRRFDIGGLVDAVRRGIGHGSLSSDALYAAMDGFCEDCADTILARPPVRNGERHVPDIGDLIATIPEPVFWQLGHDGEGPDPSLFKARLFDPDEMVRPCEGWGVTPADALREALTKFAPTPSTTGQGDVG